MKKIIVILLVIILLATALIYYYYINSRNENNLWRKTISEYIKGDLWDDVNSYDAGHVLLIPMFYAFSENDKVKKNEFHDLFSRYAEYLTNVNYNYDYWNGNHIQFNFLASNYINLCVQYEEEARIPNELLDYLYDEAFFYCLSDREKYKTDEKSNYSVLLAIERDFNLGKPIADLYQFECMIILNLKEFSDSGYYNLSEERRKIVNNTIELLYTVYTEGVTFINGNKWIMSMGAFDESEDYAYMSYNDIEDNMQPSMQENTTWDTSHFARVPVSLRIMKRANKDNQEREQYYDKLIIGLREQFLENVLVFPDEENSYYRTTNYMDGRNGLYRYNYKTQKDSAYLPYQLSGTLCLGWWCFLGREMSSIYDGIYNTFPLNEKELETYVGPNTTRERNYYVEWPNYFENGFAELICLLASKIEIDKIF